MRYVILILLLACSVCRAGDPPSGRPGRLGRSLLIASHTRWADIEGGGEVATTGAVLDAELAFLLLAYRVTEFSWRDTSAIPWAGGTAPWEQMHSMRIGVRWRRKLSDDWMVNLRGTMGVAYEEEIDDAWSWSLATMFLRQLPDEWKLAVGLGYGDHQYVDPSWHLFPIFGGTWRRAKDPGWSAAIGYPATEVRYRLNEQLALRVGARRQFGRVYRLRDSSPVIPAGYVESEGTGYDAGVVWTPRPTVRISAAVGRMTDRELQLYNASGSSASSYDLDSTWTARMSLTWHY